MGVLTRILDPDTEPVTVAELKNHCRIRNAVEDATVLPILLAAAREYVEGAVGFSIGVSTWEYTAEYFTYPIRIPMWPIQTVSYVKYYDTNDVLQTVDTSIYQLDLRDSPAIVSPAYNQIWPYTRLNKPNAVIVRFVAGMDTVAKLAKLAILMLAADWYEHREDSAEVTTREVPNGVTRIIRLLRRGNYN